MRRKNSRAGIPSPFVLTIVLASILFGVQAQEYDKQTVWPGRTWQVASSPEVVGWSSKKLAVAKAYGDSIHSSAVIIVQGGEVIYEWGDFDKKLTSYSIRKSLISALYGIYAEEGVIDVNATLEKLGIDDSPNPLTKQEKQARIVDILRARSGVYHAVDFETPDQREFRPARGSHPPGTFWFYNNWDFNVLGTIFEKKTGKKIGSGKSHSPSAWRISSQTTFSILVDTSQLTQPFSSRCPPETWLVSACCTYGMAAGVTNKSYRQLGWRKAATQTK